MKTRLWIIIGIVIFAAYLPIHYYYPFLGIGSTSETIVFSEEGFVQYEDKCVPDSKMYKDSFIGDVPESENKLADAMKKLQEIYTLNSSLGPFKMQDAIVGYGIAGDSLVVDVLEKYYESDLILIKQKIQDIVGPEVNIVFSPSGAIVPTTDCHGNARCFSGTVTKIIDGDTIKVMDESEESIRFALASAPEINTPDGIQARDYIAKICPVGSIVVIDEDDLQTQGSYGRVIAQIHCNGVNLNESILEADLGEISSEFCSKSEFALESWAIKFGCN